MVIVWLNRQIIKLSSKYLSFCPQIRQLSTPNPRSVFSQLLWRQLIKVHCGDMCSSLNETSRTTPLLKRLRSILRGEKKRLWEPEVNEDRCLIVSSEPDRTIAPVNSLTSGVVCKRPADIKPCGWRRDAGSPTAN